MDKLPPEVLHCIFIQVSLRDRIKCTLVCKGWWRVLNDYSLVHNIEIVEQPNLFHNFIAMIKRSPHRAAQVHEISLINVYLTSSNKRALVNMFPNARVLKSKWGPKASVGRFGYVSEPIQVAHSNSKLRVLHDSVHCEMVSQIFTSSLGGRLEELNLRFEDATNKSHRTVINQLNNLPVLKRLHLEDAGFGIRDLERIHENAPAIQELKLSWFDLSKSEMPSHIVPASSVTAVEIYMSSANNRETLRRFYQYMDMKYPNAAKFQQEFFQFNLHHPPADRRHIFANGLLNIHKWIVNSKVTVFRMKNIADGADTFEVLDGLGCRLEEVSSVDRQQRTFFKHLPQSDQSNYIKKIKLNNMQIAIPSILKSMMALTTLALRYTDKMVDISLTEHLNGCPPSLKRLSIACTRLLVDASNTQTSSIQVLEIKCSKFISGLDKVITSCFPDLRQLTMTGEIPHRMNITLGGPSFQCACFRPTNMTPFNFVFTPPDTDKSVRYLYNANYKGSSKKSTPNLRTLNVVSLTQKKVTTSKEIKIGSLSH